MTSASRPAARRGKWVLFVHARRSRTGSVALESRMPPAWSQPLPRPGRGAGVANSNDERVVPTGYSPIVRARNSCSASSRIPRHPGPGRCERAEQFCRPPGSRTIACHTNPLTSP
jgi:hypothetical protein